MPAAARSKIVLQCVEMQMWPTRLSHTCTRAASANAGSVQCQPGFSGGADFIVSTDQSTEKCHLGTCVGCVTGAYLISGTTVCGLNTIAFLVGRCCVCVCACTRDHHQKQVDNDDTNHPVVLCGNATRIAAREVFISGWSIVGAAGVVPTDSVITEAYLNQFVGVFAFTVYGNRYIELQCTPTTDHHCDVRVVCRVGARLSGVHLPTCAF
jgi:hypothetical protein